MKVQRGGGIRLPQAGVGTPEPHRAFVADRVGAPGFGPGHATQAGSLYHAGAVVEEFRRPPLPRNETGDLTLVAHRQCLRVRIARSAAGFADDRQQRAPEG